VGGGELTAGRGGVGAFWGAGCDAFSGTEEPDGGTACENFKSDSKLAVRFSPRLLAEGDMGEL
jgi:hypothetical protein